MPEPIAAVGAGRMGRGIAIAFAYAGHPVALIDAKPRPPDAFERLASSAGNEIRQTLAMLAEFGMLGADEVDQIAARVRVFSRADLETGLRGAEVIFEGVPETLEAKSHCLALVSDLAGPEAIIASTTSTILSNELQGFVAGPERFLNAHWLNPAFLVPLVEVSPGDGTEPKVTQRLKVILDRIGKVPVVCKASPGYIVPRIQALAMNEAARMVEEGVATAEDIDKATMFGFGFRFGILGMLEFVDWGGGDILYHASAYMSDAMQSDRFAAPQIVRDNMASGRTGLRDGQGFFSYEGRDIPAYQQKRLGQFVAMLRHLDKMPVRRG